MTILSEENIITLWWRYSKIISGDMVEEKSWHWLTSEEVSTRFTSEEVSMLNASPWEMKPLMWLPNPHSLQDGLSRKKSHFTRVVVMFQLELRFPIPISHEVPNNTCTPEGLKIVFVALVVIPSPWFFQTTSRNSLVESASGKAWCVDISQSPANRTLENTLTFKHGKNISTCNELRADPSFLSRKPNRMNESIIINFTRNETDGVDNDHQQLDETWRWHWQWFRMASAHWVNEINAWAKDIESFQMPKKPVEKTQPSSRLYPDVRIRHSVISFYT